MILSQLSMITYSLIFLKTYLCELVRKERKYIKSLLETKSESTKRDGQDAVITPSSLLELSTIH